jgi:RHS repeat-associated protein
MEFDYLAPLIVADPTDSVEPFRLVMPATARTKHKDVQHPGDPLVTISFVDGLDRVIQTKKDLERDNGAGQPTTVGMTVSGGLEFDARGRIAREGQAVFQSLSGPSHEAVSNALLLHEADLEKPTLFGHDILDRTIRVDAPDDNSPTGFATTTTAYAFGLVDGLTTFSMSVTDPNGNIRTSHRDIGQSIVQLDEFNTLSGGIGKNIVTRYAYNAIDELVQVIDTKNNITKAAYDSIGRMIELDSPDMGITRWQYDRTGNLAAKQTARLRAKAQSVRYQYDFNRIKRIDYPESQDVEYFYGPATAKGDANGNLAGRMIEERSEAGTKRFKYDRLGNVVEQTETFIRIRSPDRPPYTATISYEFDSLGRMLKMRFPGEGAEEVSYGYDRGGLIQTIIGANTQAVQPPRGSPVTNYLLHIGYNQFEQRTRVIYGNGVATDYTYDPKTRRLTDIKSDQRDPVLVANNRPARPFQRLHYTYDPVGNIKNIRNDAPLDDSMEDVFVGTTTQSFAYDNLYQLIAASGQYQDRSDMRSRYSLAFEYDEIGNILLKDQGSFRDVADRNGNFTGDEPDGDQTYRSTYSYAGPRPHAPTAIEEGLINNQIRLRELSYDESGNQAGWIYHHSEVRTNTWTEDDRLREVAQDDHKLSRIHYDGDGQKAVHASFFGNEETAYLDQHLTLTNAVRPSKHIWVDGQLLASKLDPSWFTNAPPTLYFHSDHLGSAQYATNNVQELAQHDEYFPTGEIWETQTEGRYQGERIYRFTGKELDAGTGLYYFGARWYHPRISQWISPDPILDQYMTDDRGGGVHVPMNLGLYTYVWNSPIRLLDPFGLQVIPPAPGRPAYPGAPMPPPPPPPSKLEQGVKTAAIVAGVVVGVALLLHPATRQHAQRMVQRAEPAARVAKQKAGDLARSAWTAGRSWFSRGGTQQAPAAAPQVPQNAAQAVKLFNNQLPERLAAELADAARVGAAPIRAGQAGFDKAVNQGTIKFVVTEGGELLISPHTVKGVEISHAVLSNGRPVLAAGQAEIAAAGGQYVGMRITEHSGHFMPTQASLGIAREAFAKIGVKF